MRPVLSWTVVAALVAITPTIATAQTPAGSSSPTGSAPSGSQGGTTPPSNGTTPQGGATTPAGSGATASTSSTGETSGWWSDVPSRWTVAGFIGSNFGASTSNASVDFGGQAAYLFHGFVGGEALADITPSFHVNNALVAGRPTVNAYMANGILAVPLGNDHQIQPYVSGGFGWVQLRSLTLASTSAFASAGTENDSEGAGDIGAGVMAFLGAFGFRADVRYFRAFTSTDITPGTPTASGASATAPAAPGLTIGQTLLSGLDFWRANIGVAFRW